MLEKLVLGIIYEAAHQFEMKTATEYDGWFVCGYGYMFKYGCEPSSDHPFWAAKDFFFQHEVEIGIRQRELDS